MITVKDIRQYFIDELAAERYCTDRLGGKTIEFIGASFLADEPSIFGTVNQEYVEKEIAWYLSGSTNINDIYGKKREPPQAWKYAANDYGEINSNYGSLILDPKYFSQYFQVVGELKKNPDSRRASMVYQRPSIWVDYNQCCKNDFICTNAVTYYIRNNLLHCVVQMRSNDVVFGYKNDFSWQKHILKCVSVSLEIPMGNIYWQVQNLHVYEKHFNLIK